MDLSPTYPSVPQSVPLHGHHLPQGSICHSLSECSYDDVELARLIYLFFVTHDLCFIIDPQKPQLSLCFMLFVYFYPSPPISTALNILISYVTRISWCSSVASKFDAVDWMWSMLHHKPKLAIHGSGEGGSSWIIGLNPWISSHKETLDETHRISQDMPKLCRVWLWLGNCLFHPCPPGLLHWHQWSLLLTWFYSMDK